MVTASDREDDHRVRVARERRERMEARLLAAVMACYAEHLSEGPPTVDEVIGRADVSRATFYKYFVSVDEAVEAQGRLLVADMIESLKLLAGERHSAFERLVQSVYLFLLRGVQDRTWAAFVSRGDLLEARGDLFTGLTRHLGEARADGAVAFRDVDAARTLVVGAMQEVLRAIVRDGVHRRAYLEEVMAMILIGLGLERDAAAEAVDAATIHIRGAAPDRLGWWRDPWQRVLTAE